jgi:two-component system osmolarity sensor histidine kinase EnvZ
MKLPRFDTLFARLMLVQAALLLMILCVMVIWLTVARGNAQAIPYAALWAPDMARAAAIPQGIAAVRPSSGLPLQRRFTLPPGAFSHNISQGPGASQFTAELRRRGVVVDDIRIAWNGRDFLLWIHVLPPRAAAAWLAFPMVPVLPAITIYNVSIVLLAFGLFTLVSWRFARRVTRPLENLRNRMVDAAAGMEANPANSALGAASSEIVAIDAAYHQLMEKLQHADAERVLLLAGVSHDLRSPLGRIRLAAELLPVTAATQADVATITRNIDHADRLIGSFLDFVRAGSLDLLETVDVGAVAANVIARFELPEGVLRLALPQDRPPSPAVPGVGSEPLLLPRANALLLDRLVFNLVDNALKHGRPPVRVSLKAVSGSLQLDVCDAGEGMPQNDEATLLQSFARGDSSRAAPGLGLGLAVVSQTTERLHGRLAFHRDAAGHHAVVSLPLAETRSG